MSKGDYYKIKVSNLIWIIIGVFFIVWLFWPVNYPEKNIESNDTFLESDVLLIDEFSNITEKHWGHMPLTYRIYGGCSERQNNLTRSAFKQVQLETSEIVSFIEIQEEADISIYCKPSNIDTRTGEGTLADALKTIHPKDENIIIKGEINIYGQGQVCGTGYPVLEVHEILHLFNIPHNPYRNSIMSSVSADYSEKCKIIKIDSEYISCLKYIYSNGVLNGSCDFPNVVIEDSSEEYSCDEGWYEVEGTDWCCPEPNMVINEEGYCE